MGGLARMLGRSLRGLAWLLTCVLMALVLVLALRSLREPLARGVLAWVGRTTDVHIEFGALDKLTPWGATLRKVRVRIPFVGLDVRADYVESSIDLWALTRREVRLYDSYVEGADGLLVLPEEEETAQDAAERERAADGATWSVWFHGASLRDARFAMDIAGARWSFASTACAGAGEIAPVSRLDLSRCALQVSSHGREWVALDELQTHLDTRRGGSVRARGESLGASLRLSARLPSFSQISYDLPVEKLELGVGGVDQQVLARLGVERTDLLGARVHLGAVVRREAERMRLSLVARSAGAELGVQAVREQGELAALLELTARSLAALSDGLPARSLRARLRVAHSMRDPLALRLAWSRLALDGTELPRGALRAALRESRLSIAQLTLRAHGGTLRGSGHYELESGAAQLRLSLAALPLAPVGAALGLPLSGGMSGALRFVRGARGVLAADAQLALDRAGAPGHVRTRRGRLELAVRGSLARPEGELALELSELEAGGFSLTKARLKLGLERERLLGSLSMRGSKLTLRALLSGELRASRGLNLSARGDGALSGRVLRFALRHLRYDARGNLELGELALRAGGGRLDASGALTAEGALRAELSARAVPLVQLTEPFGLEKLDGQLNLRAHLEGTTRAPRLTGELALLDLRREAEPTIDAIAEWGIDLRARSAQLALSAYGGDGLETQASAELDWSHTRGDAWSALRGARGKAQLTFHGSAARIPPVRAALGEDAPTLDLALHAEGTLEAPRASAYLELETEAAGGEHASMQLELAPERASGVLRMHDGRAPLLDAHGELTLAPRALRTLLETGEFAPRRTRLLAQLEERRWDRLTGSFARLAARYGLSLPARVSGALELSAEERVWSGRARFQGQVVSSVLDAACASDTAIHLRGSAELVEGRLRASLQGGSDRAGNLFAILAVPLATTESWLPSLARDAPASLDLRGLNLPIVSLPGLCQLGGGQAAVSLSASLPAGRAPTGELKLALHDLPGTREGPVDLEFKAVAEARALHLDARLEADERPRGTLQAHLPWRFDGTRAGLVGTAPVSAQLRLWELPVAPILRFTDALGRPSGAITADLSIGGSLRDPSAHGFVVLDDVSFSIAALAQPVRNLSGRLELAGDTLHIKELSVRDRGGRARVWGKAKLAPSGVGSAELDLRLRSFPVRQQGRVIGELTLASDLSARLDEAARLSVEARVQRATMRLSGAANKDVQSLEAHPEVQFTDTQLLPPDEPDAQQQSLLSLQSFEIRSDRDLWLVHRDFSLQLGIDLAIRQVDGETQMHGQARIVRGNLKLLGKSFNIKRGTVRFTGGPDPDPELDLTASYDPPGGGTTLTVQVTGRASDPALSFSGAAETPEEALAILSGVGHAEAWRSAEADAQNFALGVTAGLISITARREFGDWVPMFSVGGNSRGEPSQARAGFDASRLIPGFLRGVARGAYVEGILGQTEERPGSSVGLGVRLELALPRSVVTSFGYGPGTIWSADVFWVP
jgi:translocation and assembly module TamB